MTEIVASVLETSTEQMIRALPEGTVGADLIELRVDAIREPDLERLRAATRMPVILTCRSPREGGLYRGTEEARLSLIRRALELGFDYVDVEVSSWTQELRRTRTISKLILSHHAFDAYPEDPQSIVERAVELGADVVKLAVQTSSLIDCLRLAAVGSPARKRGVGFTPIAMGPSGIASRILAPRLGADFTYASARGLPSTGPGQLDLDELLKVYRFRSIGADTPIYGILGYPVAHSLSPAMHNAFLANHGIDAVYVPFEERDLHPFVDAARQLGIAGLSVTRPHKEGIRPFLDETDEQAKKVGAVNTIAVREGKWEGFNTDIEGVVSPISRRTPVEGKWAVILGAGGAARAAAFGLADRGARLVISARRLEQARSLADEVGGKAVEPDQIGNWSWDVLVNATPVGGGEYVGELPVSVLDVKPGSVVLDMVYEPEETRLLVSAKSEGAQVITGLEMLVEQAVHQAEIWTGVRPPREEMESAARAEMARRTAS
jgi:3-dehydroquinate dehydratase/shikimate dehydrogenase